MGTLMKSEGGGGGGVPAKFQKTIQSIKEIVGDFSDFEIYNALKETNMDPNETAQKLLNQDPFHEVKRRRDKKKENTGFNGHAEPRKRTDNAGQGSKFHVSDRNVNRGGYRSSASDAGISKEFRVVRDNRVNQNSDREAKSSSNVSSLANVQRISERSSSIVPNYQRHSGGRHPQNPNGAREFRSKMPRNINSDSRNGHFVKKSAVLSSESQATTAKSNDPHSQVASTVSSNVVGVYASASDPVHVPSPDTRSSAAIGAIRREVGVVGSRRQSTDSNSKQSIQQNNSNINPGVGSSSTAESFRPMNAVSRNDQTHAAVVEPVVVSSTGSRSSAHFNNKLQQQSIGHQKGRLLEAKRRHLYWTPCAAHCIDLMLEDIGKLAQVKNALKKCMFMNGYIYSHNSVVNMMRRFTNQRNLHRPAITRFATSFITLSQFHKQRNNLRKMVTSQEWYDSKWSKEASGNKVTTYLLQDTFWRNVLYALKLTGPLVMVLRIVDGERKPPMGYIYEAMDRAKEAIAKSFGNKEEYKKAFEIIDARWECQLHRPLHAAGYFLNPEFFYDNPSQASCEEVMKGLFECIGRLVPDQETQDKIDKELVAYRNASGLFGIPMALRNRKTKSPGALTVKEWKPKTTQKSSVSNPGVIGSPVKSVSHLNDPKNVESEAVQVQDKFQQKSIQEIQNVIIAQHIRVPENDRCRLTFGTFGMELDSAENLVSTFLAVDSIEEQVEQSHSNQQMNSADDQARNSGSSSPSDASSENPSPDKNNSPGISNTEDFSDMGLVDNSSSLTASTSQQHPESTELPNFSAYEQQPVYDISYFRPSIDDAVRGSGLPFSQEALSSHTANGVPSSSVGMMQQQAPMAQMYPQVHVSHYANVMPYRQFIPPMYVPPMFPGFSGNPGYPHLSNGSSYVFMPGGSSHLPANSLKYGVQQFKPFPAGSPTGFGNMANPNGYAINAPGVVGGPTGLDDSSRIKYKDNNLYVPNPQAETSEVWIQNHRDIPGMQSTPYYNMQGQSAHPDTAYLQSHAGHSSFNGAGVAQSSQLQFPGMYPQPTGIPNAHHLGGGNIGVGPAAPGPQVGAYQQPQISHLNWTGNF